MIEEPTGWLKPPKTTSVPVFDGIADLHDALNHVAALSVKEGW